MSSEISIGHAWKKIRFPEAQGVKRLVYYKHDDSEEFRLELECSVRPFDEIPLKEEKLLLIFGNTIEPTLSNLEVSHYAKLNHSYGGKKFSSWLDLGYNYNRLELDGFTIHEDMKQTKHIRFDVVIDRLSKTLEKGVYKYKNVTFNVDDYSQALTEFRHKCDDLL